MKFQRRHLVISHLTDIHIYEISMLFLTKCSDSTFSQTESFKSLKLYDLTGVALNIGKKKYHFRLLFKEKYLAFGLIDI